MNIAMFTRHIAYLLAMGLPTSAFAVDLTTPQNAIRSLEAAYHNKDIEAAIAAKDFQEEARQILLRTENPESAKDAELVMETAGVLELAFRKEVEVSGFPDFADLKCLLSAPEDVTTNMVRVIECCTYPDGSTSVEDLYVFNSAQGWRVVLIPE
jgi:hypothetical protein